MEMDSLVELDDQKFFFWDGSSGEKSNDVFFILMKFLSSVWEHEENGFFHRSVAIVHSLCEWIIFMCFYELEALLMDMSMSLMDCSWEESGSRARCPEKILLRLMYLLRRMSIHIASGKLAQLAQMMRTFFACLTSLR